MNFLTYPHWINKDHFKYQKLEDIPSSLFDEINENLDKKVNKSNPVASIIIAAWNEEVNIVRCLYTLSKNITTYSFEIIVVDNNSKDRTSETLKRLHVRSLFQIIQGCGPARQLGQENALGKYVLLADADCLYPENWIQRMMEKLTQPGVVCVYGRYSFIPPEGTSRLKYGLFETAKDIVAEVRHFKRPHLNAYGISMGYIREFGLKARYIDRNVRGDDGRLCFDLMQYGKVVQVKARDARVWTGSRTLERDGSFFRALLIRFVKEVLLFPRYLVKQAPHDTKASENDEPEILRYLKKN